MHLAPADPRPGLCHNGSVGPQHRVVHDLLFIGELPTGGEGAGDVAAVSAVLGSEVEQQHRAVLHQSVVRRPGVAVMKRSARLPSRRYAGVTDSACPAVVVDVVQERGFRLEEHD